MKAIWNDTVLAESDDTIVVEGNHYFPAEAINKEFFQESGSHTVCPWKGLANYYNVVVNGDVTQIDLPVQTTSGLVEASEIVGDIPGIEFVHFDDHDVVRHPLVQRIVRAYDRHQSLRRSGYDEAAPTAVWHDKCLYKTGLEDFHPPT